MDTVDWGHWCVNYKAIEEATGGRRGGVGINGGVHRLCLIAVRLGIWVLY